MPTKIAASGPAKHHKFGIFMQFATYPDMFESKTWRKSLHYMKKTNQDQRRIKINDGKNHRKIMLSQMEGPALLLIRALFSL